ncbi:NAD(P)-binding protein [Aspergillus ruber CBS 135680]|uniref:NAD(P)-binding protein n=1 Tax=Aspergillus ruber (strain CBS 135680) TaxID=1388766 RepID=A0A017S756_ASPRC|nr:NAD(P)-binding protein [Aspergillus ruber CBS 135680]EYE92873.1 NAD(P)-binding protein [Aspergillus ruber CBS 135680]
MATYLITGSSRGLGLALVSRLASLPSSVVGAVIATSRQDNSSRLRDLVNGSSGRVGFVPMDVTDTKSLQEAVVNVKDYLSGRGLDVLINNAGVMPVTKGGLEAMDNLNDTFNTNVTGAHQVTTAFLPLLRQGDRKVVANISTTLGSMSKSSTFESMPVPAYKITKAALNMLTVQYAQAYAQEGFTFLSLSPGWLQTDLGGSRADLPPEIGAEAVVDMVRNATTEQNGKFLNIRVPGWEENPGFNQYDGKEVPW